MTSNYGYIGGETFNAFAEESMSVLIMITYDLPILGKWAVALYTIIL